MFKDRIIENKRFESNRFEFIIKKDKKTFKVDPNKFDGAKYAVGLKC